jgi:TRAP-type C4-dicarboxylate transport system substrate-binding protein
MLRLLFGGIFIFMTCISRCRAAEPAFVISFSTQAPPSGQQFQSMLDFKQRVEAESHGQMRVDIYDSRERFDDDHVAAAVSAGRVEMGQVNVSRSPPGSQQI